MVCKDAIFLFFTHTYYFECNNPDDVMAVTKYGEEFASAAHHENIYGVQFHPEKAILMERYCYIILQNYRRC